MNLQLADKVAVITGAGGGIGSATARLFAGQGIRLALFDRNADAVRSVADGLRSEGHEVLDAAFDVTDLDAYRSAVEGAQARFGGVDYLVNVAGGGTPQTIENMSADDWQDVLALNLTGPFNAIKAVAPAMRHRGGGSIVTVASLAAIRMSMNNGVSYTSAKSGVLGLTRHAAYELGPDQIRVNAVLPGPVLTGQMKAKISPETLRRVPAGLPLGRWVQPEEVAAPILFFCSPMASACTGTHVVIDCGLHVGPTGSREEYDRVRTPKGA